MIYSSIVLANNGVKSTEEIYLVIRRIFSSIMGKNICNFDSS